MDYLDSVWEPTTSGEDVPAKVMGCAMNTSGVDQVQNLQYFRPWGHDVGDPSARNLCEVNAGDLVATIPQRCTWVKRVTTESSRAETSVKLHRVDGVFPLTTDVTTEEITRNAFFIQTSEGKPGQYRNSKLEK